MVRIIEGKASEHWDQAQALLQAHYDELTTHKNLMKLNPDKLRYLAMEEMGMMLTLLAFDGDELIGYSVNVIINNLHYQELVHSQNDLLFIHPAYRVGRTGLQLIRATEKAAKLRNAHMVLWHAKPGTTLESLLPKLGYRLQDLMFSKEL